MAFEHVDQTNKCEVARQMSKCENNTNTVVLMWSVSYSCITSLYRIIDRIE